VTEPFNPNGLPLLIGSLPMDDHKAAAALISEYTPEIPTWAQLPIFPREKMVPQFAPGLPGLVDMEKGPVVNFTTEAFDNELFRFYEEYMAVQDDRIVSSYSRFTLTTETAAGFFELLKRLKSKKTKPFAVKGQVTGPVTLATGIRDNEGKAIFFNEQLRDAAVKLIALKAGWQAQQLSGLGCPVIIFIDEPSLAGYGSSELISVSREEITSCLEEVIASVHGEGGLAGIHVCANTDWSVVLESPFDIVNFDAYAYFDKFILYAEAIKRFLTSGGVLAWGIVPTLEPDEIKKATAPALAARWEECAGAVEALGVSMDQIRSQALITPSCGTGSLSIELALKVLRLTRDVSNTIRST
jgi:methionine synthase II (cobalamin-independent)